MTNFNKKECVSNTAIYRGSHHTIVDVDEEKQLFFLAPPFSRTIEEGEFWVGCESVDYVPF